MPITAPTVNGEPAKYVWPSAMARSTHAQNCALLIRPVLFLTTEQVLSEARAACLLG